MRASARLLCVPVAVAAVLLSGCGKLDRDAVQQMVGDVVSSSAEGRLVAREARRERTYESFVEARTAELHKVAEQTQDELTATPAETGELQRVANQAAKVADQERTVLGTLREHAGDRALAGRVERELDKLSKQAEKLEEQL